MIGLQIIILALVAVSGGAVVFTRATENQPIGVSFFGLMLAVMFVLFQAPDVAFSQIVIGAVGLPLMLLLALAKLKRDTAEAKAASDRAKKSPPPGDAEAL